MGSEMCIRDSYQNNEILKETPTPEIILPIMDKIKSFDKIIVSVKKEEGIE
mgnify:CR=1 FL=1